MAVDMFLKLTGITGEAKDAKHKEEIDVLAWSWGSSQSGTTHMGGGGGAGKVNVQDLSVTKYIDAASAALLQYCCMGKHIPKASLVVRKAGGTPVEYVTLDMEEVMVSSLSTGGSGGEDRLTENLTLNFAKFKMTYKEQDEKGGKKADKFVSWNISTNTEA